MNSDLVNALVGSDGGTQPDQVVSTLLAQDPDPKKRAIAQLLSSTSQAEADSVTESRRIARDRRRHRWLLSRNADAAHAVGACPCWGASPRCPSCGGEGGPGWTDPDPDLFTALVEPALHRLGLVREDDDPRP